MPKRRSIKAGLPPGTPVHIGPARAGAVRIEIINYQAGSFSAREYDTVEACPLVKDAPGVTWINVDGVHDMDALNKIASCFGLHPLVVEDIANTDQRPKMEDYGDYIYVVVKMLYQREKDGDEIVSEQVSLILGKNFVLSFQEQGREGDVFGPVRERIKAGKGKLREMGADYLAYSLIDAVVDNYFIILERLGERVENLEDELVANPTRETLTTIHSLKRDMIFLRRSVWPLREVISSLERGESRLVGGNMRFFLRDVYDHTVQVIDTVETFRDMLSGMLDIYLSSVSNRLNEVMKVLTIIATIFIPLTFIVGVYGMNFKYMPELYLKWTYPALWGVMILVAITMLIFFKRKKWI